MDHDRPPGADDPGDGPLMAAWEGHRGYLINIAHRLLGSFSEAEDSVQEAFVRLIHADAVAIKDVRGWLVVVVTRICLDQLRSARARREEEFGQWLPEPLVKADGAPTDPADIVTLDESVRMALLIVLERLTPAERGVFALHDVFEHSFEEIAPMVDRSPAACRQLASRARRRISAESGLARAPVDPAEMRRVAERFIAACAGADLQPLLEVLDPDVVDWADLGGITSTFPQPGVGSHDVGDRLRGLFGPGSGVSLVLAEVNGETGIVATAPGRPLAVLVLDVRDGLVAAIYSIVDQRKLARLSRS